MGRRHLRAHGAGGHDHRAPRADLRPPRHFRRISGPGHDGDSLRLTFRERFALAQRQPRSLAERSAKPDPLVRVETTDPTTSCRWRRVSLMEDGSEVVDQEMLGKVGRVTGTIAPGRLGEVMVAIRGGSEAFNAYASEPDETIGRGTRVVVVEYFPPRTVVVSPV
jgi:hypothetical protein